MNSKTNYSVKILALFSFALMCSFTKKEFSVSPLQTYLNVDSVKENTIYTRVQVLPQFPGGLSASIKFFDQTIRYPKQARKNREEGRVYVGFVVEKDGSLTNFKIIRPLSDELNEEALRVLKLSPKWEPGTQNGKPVRVSYSLPISFKLND